MSQKQYKLVLDPDLEGLADKREAHSRMARAGTWLSGTFVEGGWWVPDPSQDAEKRITREGFIILDTRIEYKIEDTAERLVALGRITEIPSDETVRRWCRQGRFPNAHKKQDTRGQGGSWRIPEADLVAFVKPIPGPKGPRIRKGDSDV